MFIGLLISLVNASNHIKWISLNSQHCMIQLALINFLILHPNEYSQGLRYCSFAFNLDTCVWTCNTLNNLSNKVCAPNKIKYLNMHTFNMIIGINESKIFTKHASCKCECKFDCKKFHSKQKWNYNKC